VIAPVFGLTGDLTYYCELCVMATTVLDSYPSGLVKFDDLVRHLIEIEYVSSTHLIIPLTSIGSLLAQ